MDLLKWFTFSSSRMTAQDNQLALWEAYRIQLSVLNDAHNSSDASKNRNGLPKDGKIDALIADRAADGGKSPERTWERLYEAEQRLGRYIPDKLVTSEATKRFVEAAKLGVTSHEELKKAYLADTTPDGRRAVYLSLLDDLHFRYIKRGLDRRMRRIAAKRMNNFGAVLLAILIVVVVAFMCVEDKGVATWHIPAVIYFGALGAFFSRIASFQAKAATLDYDLIEQDFAAWAITVRLFIGSIAAAILYLLVVSKLIGGELFPTAPEKLAFVFKDLGYNLPTFDFAKLLVWSFVAGFSERLLPDQLTRLEASTQAAK